MPNPETDVLKMLIDTFSLAHRHDWAQGKGVSSKLCFCRLQKAAELGVRDIFDCASFEAIAAMQRRIPFFSETKLRHWAQGSWSLEVR